MTSLGTSAAFSVVGNVTFNQDAIVKIGAHALVGCASAAAGGGECAAGAAGAAAAKGITLGASELGIKSAEGQYVLAAVAGGTASQLAGGRFANGALTAAFGYLLNQMAQAQADEARNRPFTAGDRYVDALSVMFETSPDAIRGVSITEYSDFADHHRALAVTRVNAIYLSGSGAAFLADPRLTLHEYFHVLRQWNTGDLTVGRYLGEWVRQGFIYDRIKYEVQARDFANQNVQRYRSILEQR